LLGTNSTHQYNFALLFDTQINKVFIQLFVVLDDGKLRSVYNDSTLARSYFLLSDQLVNFSFESLRTRAFDCQPVLGFGKKFATLTYIDCGLNLVTR
jgi:hypothetical protein